MSIEQQIAQHAVELGRQDDEFERREEIRQDLINRYKKKISFNIAIRNLEAIDTIFDEHDVSFHAWLAEQLVDTYSLHAHDVYSTLIIGRNRDNAGDLAEKMASVLSYYDEIKREMNCDPTEI